MSIDKDIPELVKAGIITPETADALRGYYNKKSSSSSNRLFLAFGILGAILVGLGIILIIAHNWDELSRPIKTIFAFLPLVVAQAICFYVLLKKSDNVVWIESATTFLIFAIGACISLISQIYNIPGNLSSFLLIWMILSLPLIYVMKSSSAALLYICGITYYGMEAGYFSFPVSDAYLYWLLLAGVFPHYFSLFKNAPKSNFLTVENWLIPLSITIVLGTLASGAGELMFIAFFSLFGLFYIIGNNKFFENKGLRNNSYKVVGTLGTLILLFVVSFKGFWNEINNNTYVFEKLIKSVELWVSVGITLLACLYLYKEQKNKPLKELPLLAPIFLFFIIIFIIGHFSLISVMIINVIILIVSILTILEGAKREHLGILNLGLSIITIWIIIRFLNSDLSFVIHGLLLMAIGIGFFAANYWMLKKRRKDE